MGLSMKVRVVTLACATALTVGLLTAGTAEAAPTTTVDNVTFSAPSLTVSGLAMKAQTVTAHVVPSEPLNAYLFHLTSTGGIGTLRAIDVTSVLTSGSAADGTRSATFYVPSTADGTWTLTNVVELSAGAEPTTDVTGAPTFTVHGTHQPRLSIGVVPNAYPSTSGVIKGRLIDSDTHLGMAGVPVGYAMDTSCINWQGDGGYGPSEFLVSKKTDSNGYYSFSPYALDMLQCVGIWGAVRHNSDGYSMYPVYRLFHSPVKPAIAASPASSSSRVAQSVTVNGTVRAPAHAGLGVVVQQLHGRTAWRDVATTTVRSSGRWTSSVKPTVKGRNVFRAITTVAPGYLAGTSSTFTITGN
jgi:hypothetical protein